MSYPDVESVSSRPAASCSPPKNLKAVRFTSPVESKMYAASADESLGQNMSMNETPSLASILRSFAGADTSSDDREMLRVLIKCKTREDEVRFRSFPLWIINSHCIVTDIVTSSLSERRVEII